MQGAELFGRHAGDIGAEPREQIAQVVAGGGDVAVELRPAIGGDQRALGAEIAETRQQAMRTADGGGAVGERGGNLDVAQEAAAVGQRLDRELHGAGGAGQYKGRCGGLRQAGAAFARHAGEHGIDIELARGERGIDAGLGAEGGIERALGDEVAGAQVDVVQAGFGQRQRRLRTQVEWHGKDRRGGCTLKRLAPTLGRCREIGAIHGQRAGEHALAGRLAEGAAQLDLLAVGEGRFDAQADRPAVGDGAGVRSEAGGHAAVGERTVCDIGAGERASGDVGVDACHALGGAGLDAAERHRAVAHDDAVDSEVIARQSADAHAGALAGGGNRPVRAAVGQHLELEHGVLQHEAAHRDVAAQQRGEGDLDVEGAELQQRRHRRAARIGDAHLRRGERGRRQQMEIHVAADDHGTAHRLLNSGGDLVPILVPVNEARGCESRAHENNEREGSPYEDAGH